MNPVVFEHILEREQKTEFWRSEGSEENEYANKLQALFQVGKSAEYDTLKQKLEGEGHQFRLTLGQVYEIFPSDVKRPVQVKFQVKGSTITWSIIAPMDETHQSFRDEIYRTAALAHIFVKNHCEKYWRGTNSLHVKKMHTGEHESMFNHNHYRLKDDKDATPTDVKEHLYGFVEGQKKLALTKDGQEKFLTKTEADEIIHRFTVFYLATNHTGKRFTTSVDGVGFSLPARDISLLTTYKNSPSQRLTAADIKEWEENKSKEEPCTTIDLDAPLEEIVTKLDDGMRGLGSELAQTRQVEGSILPTFETVVTKDDLISVKQG